MTKGFDAFALKWIAVIGMILNHMVYAWQAILPTWLLFPLYAAGGLTFSIMAYFAVEGYRHTSNLKRYLLRLLVFGAIAMPFHALVFGVIQFNIMFTIILGIALLVVYDKAKRRALFWLVFALALPLTFFVDLNVVGVLMIVLYHIIPNEKARRIAPSVMAGVSWFFVSLFGIISLARFRATPGMEAQIEFFESAFGDMNFMMASATFFVGCFAAAFLLIRHNGERGKKMKWMFYAFYPLHLAFLAGVAIALGLIDFDAIGTFGLIVVR